MNEAREIIAELLEEARQYVDEVGGCDHPVGICCCDVIRKIERAERYLDAFYVVE